MKYKILLTIILFLFSILYIYNSQLFLQENDQLMIEIKQKEKEFYQDSVNAFIGKDIIIAGLSGQRVNLKKSYQKMKQIKEFNSSLLVFEEIRPNKSIKNIYNKIIVSGNQTKKRISIILHINNEYLFSLLNKICISNKIYVDILTNKQYNLQDTNFQSIVNTDYLPFINYCITYQLNVKKDCINHHKYTFLGYYIDNNFLTKTKEKLYNGRILVYEFNQNNYQNFSLIIKYLKNNGYEIISLKKIII